MNSSTAPLPSECVRSLAEESRNPKTLLNELSRQLALLLPNSGGYVSLASSPSHVDLWATFGSIPQLDPAAAKRLIEDVCLGFDARPAVLPLKPEWKHGFPEHTEYVAAAPIRAESRLMGNIAAGLTAAHAAQEAAGLIESIAALAGIHATNAHEFETLVARTSYLEDHDALVTGLPNRACLYDRTRAALLEGAPALLFLDLDGFNEINRRHGYAAGDAALAEVARRWQNILDQHFASATLARMGGDEFAVLLPAGTAEAAEALAEVLLSALHEPLHALVEPWPLRASAGVSRCSETVCSVERLVRRAERAMYRAKEAGGSQYAVATEEPTTPPNSNSHD